MVGLEARFECFLYLLFAVVELAGLARRSVQAEPSVLW